MLRQCLSLIFAWEPLQYLHTQEVFGDGEEGGSNGSVEVLRNEIWKPHMKYRSWGWQPSVSPVK